MKILVCISNVPDTTTKIRFDAGMKNLDTNGVQWVINPWDELALTRALEIKEQSAGKIEKVSVVNIGKADAEPTIRKALAIGADDAFRVDADPTDAYTIAAMTGSIAEAYFSIPEAISNKALTYLDEYQLDILQRFEIFRKGLK